MRSATRSRRSVERTTRRYRHSLPDSAGPVGAATGTRAVRPDRPFPVAPRRWNTARQVRRCRWRSSGGCAPPSERHPARIIVSERSCPVSVCLDPLRQPAGQDHPRMRHPRPQRLLPARRQVRRHQFDPFTAGRSGRQISSLSAQARGKNPGDGSCRAGELLAAQNQLSSAARPTRPEWAVNRGSMPAARGRVEAKRRVGADRPAADSAPLLTVAGLGM